MFRGVQKDDRSEDEDEGGEGEEVVVESEGKKALKTNGVATTPKVRLNGDLMRAESNGHLVEGEGSGVQGRKATLRKR